MNRGTGTVHVPAVWQREQRRKTPILFVRVSIEILTQRTMEAATAGYMFQKIGTKKESNTSGFLNEGPARIKEETGKHVFCE